jgi:hypothetical protein
MFNKTECNDMCTIHFTPVSLSLEGFRFQVEADMLFVCRSVGDNDSLAFTPVLCDPAHRLELPSVLVAGVGRYRALRHTVKGLFGRPVLHGSNIRKILKAENPSMINYTYSVQLDYEEWMSGAQVSLLQSL